MKRRPVVKGLVSEFFGGVLKNSCSARQAKAVVEKGFYRSAEALRHPKAGSREGL